MSTGTRLLAVGMSAFTVSSKWRCSCCRTDKHRIMQSVPTKQAAVAIIIGFKFQAVQLLQCLFLSIILSLTLKMQNSESVSSAISIHVSVMLIPSYY